MDFLFDLLTKIAGGAAPLCGFIFFEAEVPESLREE